LLQFGTFRVVLGGAVAIWIVTVAVWIGGWIARRRLRSSLALTREQGRRRLMSRVGAIALLAMLGGWVALISVLSAGNGSIDGWLAFLYILGVLASVGAVALIVEASLRVLYGPGGWLVRMGETLLGLSGLFALWMIVVYGLANFSFTY
jgi:hypothetical protein